jgi:catechol 2,3-dioxygenase-like lactoylglutathione lyase family enzyme
MPRIESISAVTLATRDMARAVRFYEALGFELAHGGATADFTSYRAGAGHLNLMRVAEAAASTGWGRVIFHVDDVDAMHAHAVAHGLPPEGPARDGPWGERYFHITDPDGHALSFARRLPDSRR